MKIGFDIDGVFADFNASFIERVIASTGKDLFPPRPFDIPTWGYPQLYGYTKEEESKVWNEITKDPYFWYDLSPYSDTQNALYRLSSIACNFDDDVYFITSRPGVVAKAQTERWLRDMGVTIRPTVLISSAKGLCAQALKLDTYIDDRWENCMDVAGNSNAVTSMLVQPWNRDNDPAKYGIREVATVDEFLDNLEALR